MHGFYHRNHEPFHLQDPGISTCYNLGVHTVLPLNGTKNLEKEEIYRAVVSTCICASVYFLMHKLTNRSSPAWNNNV